MFQPVYRYFKNTDNNHHISAWKCKRLSDKSIKFLAAYNYSLAPALNHIYIKPQAKFDGSCLKQEKVTFTHKKVVNIYFVYEVNLWSHILGAIFVLGNSLLGAVKSTKNPDSDKYKWWSFYLTKWH